MNKFTKSMLATALLIGAGAANAALVTNSSTGDNSMFLSVFDPDFVTNASAGEKGRTFNLDLGVTYNQFVANPTAAISSVNLATAGGSDWTSFMTGAGANLKYVVLGANFQAQSMLTTTNGTGLHTVANDATSALGAFNIREHAQQINVGLVGNSSVINENPVQPVKGQFNANTLLATGYWNGFLGSNPVQSVGQSSDFYKTSFHTIQIDDGFGGTQALDVMTAEDITKLGAFLLSGNTLTFSAAGQTAVPLPAAVWMFGAGLMGVLRSTRRKAA
ncbi:hypothetical protein MGMO_30c00040 [Methyloglobulus morosus KoM1]|uniref:Uncharacterized protein n=1 Tax=Methyloglobulus morosus KoM1 TaxID=1116472 RepID=V5BZG0_9GAMM|nr:VPLPA-CTERM sorting domain-containing protein [Methyloglobulus morosus]ESS73209.1 hypothetical protein MGMO_30c00040 [Methyloglobulus morosus KoM1]